MFQPIRIGLLRLMRDGSGNNAARPVINRYVIIAFFCNFNIV